MATSASGEFEVALKRLEEIVRKLEHENVALDESVALLKEGKALSAKCEGLLKDAQSSIEATALGNAAEPVSAAPASLFGSGSGSGSGRAGDADPGP